MADFDYAIVGTSLLAGLLAGLLARDHGKRVVRIGRRPSAQRLPRALDLALRLATRPDSWQLFRQAEIETRMLLARLGMAEAMSAVEVALDADLPDSAAALDHLAHLAIAHGHQIRRTAGGWAFRQIAQLRPDRDKLDAWLASLGVAFTENPAAIAGQIVLADDAALLEHLAEAERPPQLVAQAMMATLIVSPRPASLPVQRFVDRGVTLAWQPGHALLGLVSGDSDSEARLASTLTGPFPMKRLATTRYRRMITADGAPLIGRLAPSKFSIIAGLGDAGAFLAPALARCLAGQPNAGEAAWFAAHEPSRPRAAIADFTGYAA